MTTENDDLDTSWDTLADELGVDSLAPTAQPALPSVSQHSEIPAKAVHKPQPEPEPFYEESDFGGGLDEEPLSASTVEPAPQEEEFAEESDADDFGSEEGAEGSAEEGVSEEGEGKKKRRRRRRRRKKGGGGTNPESATAAESSEPESGEFQAAVSPTISEEEETVEEGEAPGELSDDEGDHENLSAVDEEMSTVSNEPRQEWKVMSWNELIGKLHRPN